MTEDRRVTAIRNDKKVGRGTCSSIDECLTDDELIAMLDAEKITTATAAVIWARNDEAIRNDYAEDIRNA